MIPNFRFCVKQILSCLLLATSLGMSLAHATPPTGYNWNLTFSDEFNGTSLDTTKWNTTYWWGGRSNTANAEAQTYVDNAFLFNNGMMSIQANTDPTYKYTSGMITSFGKFSQQYGYFEMRAKLPKGQGFWPAFWMLPDSKTWPPEIDIFENLGQQPSTLYMNLHPTDTSINFPIGVYNGPDFSSDFHTFGLLWTPTQIVWYVDDVPRYQTTVGIPKQTMYILANLAVGGNWGGYPDATTVFPSYYTIDYIRAYSQVTSTRKHGHKAYENQHPHQYTAGCHREHEG